MFPRPLLVSDVRARVRGVVAKPFKLVYGLEVLADGEPLRAGDDEVEALVSIVFVSFTVVTWGDGERGGDCSLVAERLSEGVISVTGNDRAFAALKISGEVVTWGEVLRGGDSSVVADRLAVGVISISGTDVAFAALKNTGGVVTWGDEGCGGDCRAVADRLTDGVVSIFGNYGRLRRLEGNRRGGDLGR